MRVIGWAILLVVSGCSSSPVRPLDGEDVTFDLVRLHRFACLGRCPVYTIEVTSHGNVTYRGEQFVASVGERHGVVNPADLILVSRTLAEIKFSSITQSDLKACATLATDFPSVDVDVIENGRNHHVAYYYGCSTQMGSDIDRLSKVVDDVTGVRRWIK